MRFLPPPCLLSHYRVRRSRPHAGRAGHRAPRSGRCRIPRFRRPGRARHRIAGLCHCRRLCRLAVPGDRPGAGGREGRLVPAGAVPPRVAMRQPPRLTLTIGGKRIALEQGKDAALRPSVTAKSRKLSAGLRVRRLWASRTRATDSTIIAGWTCAGKSSSRCRARRRGCRATSRPISMPARTRVAAAAGAIGFVELSRSNAGRQADSIRCGAAAVRWSTGSMRRGRPGRFRRASSSSSASPTNGRRGCSKELRSRSMPSGREAKSSKVRPRGFALTPTLAVEAESKWEDFTSPEVVGPAQGLRPGARCRACRADGSSRPSGREARRQAGRGRHLQWRARQCGGRRDHAGGGAAVRGAAGAAEALGPVHRQHRRGARPARRRLLRQSSRR